MEVSNAVVGGKVQIKRDCIGHSGESIYKGLVCTVTRIDDSPYTNYELRLKHPDIDCGFAWVNALECRKYTEAVEEEPIEPTPEPELTCADVQVGDWLVYNERDILAEGTAYKVVGVHGGGSITIANHTSDTLAWQARYWTRTGYFNKVLREVTPRG